MDFTGFTLNWLKFALKWVAALGLPFCYGTSGSRPLACGLHLASHSWWPSMLGTFLGKGGRLGWLVALMWSFKWLPGLRGCPKGNESTPLPRGSSKGRSGNLF